MAKQQMANANGPGTSQADALPDGLAQSIQQPYIQNGLTYQSNNKFVMQRDTAGNIILDANADTVQHLIIEPAVEQILNKSVVEVFDTRFNYFKFPAKSKGLGSDAFTLNTDLDTDAPIEVDNLSDLYNSRYTVPINFYKEGSPKIWKRLSIGSPWTPTSNNVTAGNIIPIRWFSNPGDGIAWQYYWYTNGPDGDALRGWQRVDFSAVQFGVGQINRGEFQFDQDTITQLKEQNKTLQFNIKLATYIRSYADGVLAPNGQRGCPYGIHLSRNNPEPWRTNPAISPSGQMVYDANMPPNNVKLINENGTDSDAGYFNLRINYIVDINEALPYDAYSINAVCRYESYYLADRSYWEITVIDDPGTGNYGVQ